MRHELNVSLKMMTNSKIDEDTILMPPPPPLHYDDDDDTTCCREIISSSSLSFSSSSTKNNTKKRPRSNAIDFSNYINPSMTSNAINTRNHSSFLLFDLNDDVIEKQQQQEEEQTEEDRKQVHVEATNLNSKINNDQNDNSNNNINDDDDNDDNDYSQFKSNANDNHDHETDHYGYDDNDNTSSSHNSKMKKEMNSNTNDLLHHEALTSNGNDDNDHDKNDIPKQEHLEKNNRHKRVRFSNNVQYKSIIQEKEAVRANTILNNNINDDNISVVDDCNIEEDCDYDHNYKKDRCENNNCNNFGNQTMYSSSLLSSNKKEFLLPITSISNNNMKDNHHKVYNCYADNDDRNNANGIPDDTIVMSAINAINVTNVRKKEEEHATILPHDHGHEHEYQKYNHLIIKDTACSTHNRKISKKDCGHNQVADFKTMVTNSCPEYDNLIKKNESRNSVVNIINAKVHFDNTSHHHLTSTSSIQHDFNREVDINDNERNHYCSDNEQDNIKQNNQNHRGYDQEGHNDSSTSLMEDNDNANLEYDKPSIQTRFSDIIGHGHAKLRLDEMLLPLALPPSLAQHVLTGVRAAPASILLYGPPGTGKTQLARAVAGEAQAAFMAIGPSDVLSKFVGESEQSIKLLFEEAKNKARRMESRCTVLFFDEIDALGISRNTSDIGGREGGDSSISGSTSVGGGGGEQSSRRILAELLIQLSNLSSSSSVIDDSEGSSSDTGYHSDDAIDGPAKYNTIFRNIMNEEIESHQEECITFQKENKEPLDSKPLNREVQVADDMNSKADENSSCPHLISPSSTSTNNSKNSGTAIESGRNCNPRIIVIAATNRPEDCDPALLRRFAIRVLVGLPTHRDRRKIMSRLLEGIQHNITMEQLKALSNSLEGWSGSDLESVTREAVMAPIRECLRSAAIMKMKARRQSLKIGAKNDKTKHVVESGIDIARNELLNRFKNLRPVSIHDFELAVSFWIGDGHDGVSTRTKDALGSCHYDSDSTCEDNTM